MTEKSLIVLKLILRSVLDDDELPVEDERVLALAAGQRVVAEAARNLVVAEAAVEHVLAGAAHENIRGSAQCGFACDVLHVDGVVLLVGFGTCRIMALHLNLHGV